MGENNKKDGQSEVNLYFQQLKEKLSYIYFFSISNEESHSARKHKITSGVFNVFFKNSAKKGHIINNLLTSLARSLQGNLRPRQGRGLRFPCNDLTPG